MIFFTKMYALCEMRKNNYFWSACDLLLILRSRVNIRIVIGF